ncbi:SEC-C metal-binding domain-containing protein [Psychrobacillus sp. MER TA 171]|uniref:SEC-C metal-binding domain-containing protein n=1 Tax=Psychrobacillus sp. MER TA 171 TaxID=2939577 RepID=UPI00203D1578|nr:SEC-C metal-binding domain-containing protein [Psychrobacillus sp. MER TA 171]MCM3356503.1 SEC-C metal-binding domain-containing protein [Psychrobacillus sp. MER TA 171]
MTIGRNDPCPCGSGKKYKKCHGAKDVVSIDKVVEGELRQILESYYAEYPQQKDMFELNMTMNTWDSRLRGIWEKNQIELLALDYYLLIKKEEQWKNYLEKQMKKSSRASVTEVLKEWTSPIILIGKVTKVKEETILVQDMVSGTVHEMEKFQSLDINLMSYIVGIVFSDHRKGSNGISIATGFLIMPEMLDGEMKRIKEFAKKSKLDSRDFLKENLLECFELLQEDVPEISPAHQEILEILEEFLDENDLSDEMLMPLLQEYLIACSPNPRKKEAVAAGAVRFANEYLSFDTYDWTNKEIAETFDVSPSTVKKYFEEIEEFYLNMGNEIVEELDGSQPMGNFRFEVGTYPRLSEYRNWELLMHMDSVEIESEEEMQRLVSQFMNKPYEPKNNSEKAQLNAYEGYFAETEQLRNNYWKIAELSDPNNPDVLLHNAELAKNEKTAREFYKKAIKEAYKQFDSSFDVAWGYVPNRPYLRALFAYGVWEFELGNFDAALDQFLQVMELNPNDKQGARYLLVSTMLHLGSPEEAEAVLALYPNPDDATYEYLSFQTKKMLHKSQGKPLREKELEPIMDKLAKLNPLALYLLAMDHIPSEPYPKSAVVTAKSHEEAQLIHTLMEGFDMRE